MGMVKRGSLAMTEGVSMGITMSGRELWKAIRQASVPYSGIILLQ